MLVGSSGLGVSATPELLTVTLTASYSCRVTNGGTKTAGDPYLDTDAIYRGCFEWDTTSIPDTATIDYALVTFTATACAGTGTRTANFYPMPTYQPSVASGANTYTDAGDGTTYGAVTWLQAEVPATKTDSTVLSGATPCADIQAGLAANWFAVGLTGAATTQDTLGAYNHATTSYRPVLKVWYHYGSYAYHLERWAESTNTQTAGSFAITATESDGQEAAITITDTANWITCDSELESVVYPISATEYRYYIFPTAATLTPLYIPAATTYTFLWSIRDIIGLTGNDDCYLHIQKMLGGSYKTVEDSWIIDTINGIPCTLTLGQIYRISVIDGSDVEHLYGYFLAVAANDNPVLTLSELSFDQEIQYVATNIPVVVTRNVDKTNISIDWANLITPTYDITDIEYTIKDRSGATIDSDSSSAQSGTFTSIELTNTTDVVVFLEIQHEYFGLVKGTWAFEGFDSYAAVPDLTDLGLTFGGINTSSVIGVALLMFVAGIFSAGSAPVGAVIVTLMGGVLARLGFLSVTDTLLALAICLAVMFALSRRGGVTN